MLLLLLRTPCAKSAHLSALIYSLSSAIYDCLLLAHSIAFHYFNCFRYFYLLILSTAFLYFAMPVCSKILYNIFSYSKCKNHKMDSTLAIKAVKYGIYSNRQRR